LPLTRSQDLASEGIAGKPCVAIWRSPRPIRDGAMIRVITYLLVIGLLAFGAVWLADRPGDVAITWLGHRIETSVMVLAIAVVAVAVLAAILWSTVRAVMRSPDLCRRYLRTRRGVRGYLAVSQGLVAVGSGDAVAARKFMEEASRIAPGEPLTLLLRAQTAQLCGDREGAARSFELMAGRDDTRLLGLHGLFIEARRRNDPAAALAYAEGAAKHVSVPGWAGQAVLEFRCIAGDWSGALHRLDCNMKSGLVHKATYRRQRAVLLTAQALAAEDGDRDRAKAVVLEAAKLAPDLVPAAALAGRLLAEAGELRKAGRIIETAWRANPHPDLADAYAHLQPGDSARERLARIEALAARSPGNVEAALAVARAALDAQEFVTARQALAPLVIVPTKRVAALMAELEQMQHGDEGRAREWMMRALNARRDPAWSAYGFVSERWLPVSPVTGLLDAFEWKDPLAGDDHAGAVIEAQKTGMEETGMLDARRNKDVEGMADHGGSSQTEVFGSEPRSASGAGERTEAAAASAREVLPPVVRRTPRPTRSLTSIPVPPAVIPLVHAPDDPGPEPQAQIESQTHSTGEGAADNWSRIRHLFRP
jgi:HemY protein